MAKKRRASKASNVNWRSIFRSSLRTSTSSVARRRNRRANKHRRSKSYWIRHSDVLYSKVIIRDAERIWLSINDPEAIIETKLVDQPELFPRYQRNLWDGQAVFVTFSSRNTAASFKGAFWSNKD